MSPYAVRSTVIHVGLDGRYMIDSAKFTMLSFNAPWKIIRAAANNQITAANSMLNEVFQQYDVKIHTINIVHFVQTPNNFVYHCCEYTFKIFSRIQL